MVEQGSGGACSGGERVINTANDFLFGWDGQTLQPVLPVIITSRDQALRTAAWLKTMAVIFPGGEVDQTFEEIELAIRNT